MSQISSRRNCYFEDERKLKYFNKYTKVNCAEECVTNSTLEICKCVRFYFVRDGTSKLCSESFDKQCFIKVISMLMDEESTQFKACGCLPSCNSIDYNFDIHYDKIKGQKEANFTEGSITISFADDEFLVFKRSESFGAVTLLSNIGGLLGFFLGVSVLSLVEIFYFFVIRFINNLWWTKST